MTEGSVRIKPFIFLRVRSDQETGKPFNHGHILKKKYSVVSMKLFRCLYFILSKCQVLFIFFLWCHLDINQFLNVQEGGAGGQADLDRFIEANIKG